MIAKLYHSPGDWLAAHTNARDRRSFGFWTLTLAIVGAFFFGQAVLYVTVLSILALIPNVLSETPVEIEADVDVNVNNEGGGAS
jgi:hypothetical protein